MQKPINRKESLYENRKTIPSRHRVGPFRRLSLAAASVAASASPARPAASMTPAPTIGFPRNLHEAFRWFDCNLHEKPIVRWRLSDQRISFPIVNQGLEADGSKLAQPTLLMNLELRTIKNGTVMKMTRQMILLGLAGVLLGCNRNDQARDSAPPTTAQDVKEKYKEAALATKNYVAENKDEFVATMDKKLTELDEKISVLAKKSEGYKDNAKVEADKALAALREERKTAGEQFDKVKKASAEAWKDVKAGFATAMDKLEETYDKVKARFN